MAIFETKVFRRWARKEGLGHSALCKAVQEMTRGLVDADLGSGLLKKRIARAGQGKSGGYRTLVVTNHSDRWVFVFGFPKNVRSNIRPDEEEALKRLAGRLLMLSAVDIQKAVRAGELMEVKCDDEEEVGDSRSGA